MNPAQLIQIIQQNEGQQTEFKLESEKQGDLAEVLMALPMPKGELCLSASLMRDRSLVWGMQKLLSIDSTPQADALIPLCKAWFKSSR